MNTEGAYKGHWLGRTNEYPRNPRIYFGVGLANKLGNLIKDVAINKNCIIITDKSLAEIGLIKNPKKSLEDHGFTVELYKAKPEEPESKEMEKIIEVVKEGDYGLVVGLGGGSCMDKAKIAATISEAPGQLQDYVAPSSKPLKESKPIVMLPTTSGTGSECSNTAVVIVSHKEMGTIKTWITGDPVMADAAVIDPSLTLDLPPRVTAGSGMDALSHTAEAVLSLQANPFSDAISLKAIELVSQNLRTAYHQGDNIEARWNMSLAASIGGMVISYDWIAGPAVLAHVASEGISAKYEIPHGEGCGVLLPYVYWFNLPSAYGQKKLAKIAQSMGEDISGLNSKDASKKAITATFDLLEDIDLPTNLRQYDIPEKDIPLLAEYVLERAEDMYSMPEYNPRKATLDNLKEFFRKALEGRQSIDKPGD